MAGTVEKYRQAAMALYGITRAEAERSIYAPADDPGEWAPSALAIINFEQGHLGPASYWSPRGIDECFRLSNRAGEGFIEYINAAVAAVWRG